MPEPLRTRDALDVRRQLDVDITHENDAVDASLTIMTDKLFYIFTSFVEVVKPGLRARVGKVGRNHGDSPE